VNLGSAELLIVVVLLVVVFGAGWLPKAARNLGRAKVEIDKTQKQLTEAKQQVVEATGMDKAEATLRKANRALNTSPKNLIKGAAISAIAPAGNAAEAAAPDAEAPATPDAEAPATEAPDDEAPATEAPDADASDAETVNVDWSGDDAD